ncbi:MAG: 2-oxoacid:acceptor oxidoreductase family protein [Methanomassiliicoccaceae archaeon]|nr:2-oxoacid:acceptor oxidoreductase family protein [Methanomassiliicoccaceae archaeon]
MELCWHGRGGQGVVTANEILASSAIREGKYVKAFPEFGPERMGAPIRAFTRISSDPIRIHSQVYTPDIVIILDPTLVGKIKTITAGLKKDSVVLGNYAGTPKELQEALQTDAKCYAVDATRISTEEVGRPMVNTSMLGAVTKVSGIVSFNTLEEQVRAKFGNKLQESVIVKNLSALKRAYTEVQ